MGEGTVLGAGAILTGSMPVIDVETGEELVEARCRPGASLSPVLVRSASQGASSAFLRCSSSSASKRGNDTTSPPSTTSSATTVKRSDLVTDVVAPSLPTGDVFALTAALVDIASESFNEQEIVAVIEAELRACPHLTVDASATISSPAPCSAVIDDSFSVVTPTRCRPMATLGPASRATGCTALAPAT